MTISSSQRYGPSIWVRAIESQDGIALLDIRQGLCLGVNPVGAEIWNGLKLGMKPNEIAARIAVMFDEPGDHILDDVRHYLDNLSENGLLSDDVQTGWSAKHAWVIKVVRLALFHGCWGPGGTRFLLAKSLFALATFDLLRFSTDFAAMFEFVRKWPFATRVPTSSTVDLVCAAVNYACVWYPKRVLCLQRSAVTTCLLRTCGVKAQMVLGAQQVPFRSHAWTEVEGIPVNERRDVRATYLLWDHC